MTNEEKKGKRKEEGKEKKEERIKEEERGERERGKSNDSAYSVVTTHIIVHC